MAAKAKNVDFTKTFIKALYCYLFSQEASS